MSEYTKKKWTARKSIGEKHAGDYEISSNEIHLIARIYDNKDGFGGRNEPRCVKANAHLISACPTMYEYIEKKAKLGDQEAIKIISKITLDL